MSYLTEIADAVDGAIGSGGGFIVVQNVAQREMAQRALTRLAAKASVPGIEARTEIRVVPGARAPHFRVSMPGE